jgi:putative ABC transport system permease protein
MIRNYLKITLRNLARTKLYSTINIVGLSIGVTTVILLMLFVKDEWSFDQFHQNHDRIYRAWVKEHFQGEVFFNSISPYVLGDELKDNFPAFENVVRYMTIGSQVKKGEFSEQEEIHIVENGFFEMFNFPVLAGKVDEMLSGVHQVVITEEMGLKYFNDSSPIGQIVKLQLNGDWIDFTVSGIVEKAPSNSSIQYDFILPLENMKTVTSEGGRTSWTIVNVETYVMTKPGVDIEQLSKEVAPFIDDRVAGIYEAGEYIVGFQPITDIHLNKGVPVGLVQVSDARYPKILGWVALLILLLGAINFTTLAVGRSVSRAKEVGVRKVNGATRQQLIGQFFSESIFVSTISVLMGGVLAKILLPFFNQVAEKSLSFHMSFENIIFLAALALVTGTVSGIYPAIVQSGFKPIRSLRGKTSKSGSQKHWVLKGLVVSQFVLSSVLIVCTLIMGQQLGFLQSQNLGFEKKHQLIIPFTQSGRGLADEIEKGKQIAQRLRNELGGNTDFSGFSMSTHTFGAPGWSEIGYSEEGSEQYSKFKANEVDEEFVALYQLEIKEGRNLSKDMIGSGKYVVVNEAYQKLFDVQVGEPMQPPFKEYTVLGIMADFHFESLHNKISPLVLTNDIVGLIRTGGDYSFEDFPNPKISAKIVGANIPIAISSLKKVWERIAPEQAFEFSFVDDNLNRQYRAEARLSFILRIATGLAILIACMGLFGIASLSISQRTKEIGVRKVLGASAHGIFGMLSKEFIILAAIALVIAAPIAFYLMREWLQDFAYNIGVKWWIFVIAGGLLILITLITVSYQSIRAAMHNPADSLRTE